jgi:DNA-binding transcriptional ArsR family regulator
VSTDPDLATIGAALADEGRAAMLLALLGGERLTAGELARCAQLSPSAASNHLRRLRELGLIVDQRAGRNRFFKLASHDFADALEALARVAPAKPVRNLRQSNASEALRNGRTCYDHLAGRLGVAVTDALVERRILTRHRDAFSVSRVGRAWLAELGIDVAAVARSKRSFARICIDWTEQRPHLAGALGAAITETFFDRAWLRRLPNSRAVTLTRAGEAFLARELAPGIETPAGPV